MAADYNDCCNLAAICHPGNGDLKSEVSLMVAFPSTLDAATLGTAFRLLEKELGGGAWRVTWDDSAMRDVQRRWITWFEASRPQIEQLRDIKSLVSTSAAELNLFLQDNNFKPMFEEICDGVGVAAII